MRLAAIALASMIALAASTAPASASDEGAMRISASVAPVCAIDPRDLKQTAPDRLSGNIREFCNGGPGFQVIATHRALGENESAYVTYGNSRVELGRSGLSVLARRDGLRFATVPVEVDASELEAPLSLAFSISTL